MSVYILLETSKIWLLKQIKLGVLLYIVNIHSVCITRGIVVVVVMVIIVVVVVVEIVVVVVAAAVIVVVGAAAVVVVVVTLTRSPIESVTCLHYSSDSSSF